MNGPPNTKVNFSYNKCLNLTTKFGVLGFLGIVNLQKNLVALSQKLWIFLWCLTFASYYPAQKTELWLAKVRHKKKIHNFWDRVTKFFLQVGNTQKPKHTKFGSKLKPFIARKIHFCVRGDHSFFDTL